MSILVKCILEVAKSQCKDIFPLRGQLAKAKRTGMVMLLILSC